MDCAFKVTTAPLVKPPSRLSQLPLCQSSAPVLWWIGDLCRLELQEEVLHHQSLCSSILPGNNEFQVFPSASFLSSVFPADSVSCKQLRRLLGLTFPCGGYVFGLWLFSVDTDFILWSALTQHAGTLCARASRGARDRLPASTPQRFAG